MYLLAKCSGHRSYGNGDVNSYINSYMNTSEKGELTSLVGHIERFSKSEVPIYISEVPDTAFPKNEKKNIGNCKALCISRERNKIITVNKRLQTHINYCCHPLSCHASRFVCFWYHAKLKQLSFAFFYLVRNQETIIQKSCQYLVFSEPFLF